MAGAASGPLAEIEAFVQGHGGTCSVGLFIRALSEERQQAVALAASRVAQPGQKMTYAAIGKALRSWGHTGQPDNVARHLSGRCACPR